MLKRVLIIHPEGNSFNNPTMKCVIDLLCDHDVDVHISHQRTVAPMPPYRGIKYHPWGRFWGRIKNIVLNKISFELVRWIVFYSESILFSRSFDLIIGIDREGLVQASYLSRLFKKPYVFFSFEIMFEKETSARFKKIERDASKLISKWFIQDAERGDILKLENHLDPSCCINVPLASKGIGYFSSKRLRDDLGIPQHFKVAIIMGSLSNWSMTPDILRSIASWPSGWCLMVHGRYGQASEYINNTMPEILNLIGTKLFISDTPVDMVDDMSYLLSGVEVGLAFYKPDYSSRYVGKNLEHLGLASGKISTYLRYGIPVVMNRIGMYAKLAEEHEFGVVVDTLEQLPGALKQTNNSQFSWSAIQFFTSHLDFSLFEDAVMRQLEDAAASW